MRYRIKTWETSADKFRHHAERAVGDIWVPIGNPFDTLAGAELAIKNFGKYPRIASTTEYNGNGVPLKVIPGGKGQGPEKSA